MCSSKIAGDLVFTMGARARCDEQRIIPEEACVGRDEQRLKERGRSASS